MTSSYFGSYTLDTLPLSAQYIINQQHVIKERADSWVNANDWQLDLFSDFVSSDEDNKDSEPTLITLRWGTDSYWHQKHDADIDIKNFHIIKLRHEKTFEEQKKRSKKKAEVFTPMWVVNMQNNLVDEQIFGRPNVINVKSDDKRTWVPTEKIEFDENYKWFDYVADRRLEMCCGEGPYLFSRYDATTGEFMPVRDGEGRFQRVGILDRKLRAAIQVCDTVKEWDIVSEAAMRATYGFEWQGDNLLLARLNFINTYFEYEAEFYNKIGRPLPPGKQVGGRDHKRMLHKVAELASWQLWQMDGLKMVVPNTCSRDCKACKKKLKTGHDGILPVVQWGKNEDGTPNIKIFEDFLVENGGK